MADNVIETGRSRIEDILLKASNGEALSRIEEILLSLYQDLVHLDDQGLIPASLLPPQVFEHCEVVVDDTARFALTQDDVQNGDLVYVNSSQTMYFVLDDTKLDREAGYLPIAAGVAAKAIADEYGNNISQTYATKQELGGKQDTIDSDHKLSADNVDDTNSTNKFATQAQLDQINTNKNNISKVYTENGKTTNLIDFDTWANCGTHSGTKEVSGNSVKLTAVGGLCFTYYKATDEQYPIAARIPCSSGDKFVFTWKYTAHNFQDNDKVGIFGNGLAYEGQFTMEDAATEYMEYTVPNDVSFITFRISVQTSGNSATYSNLQIQRKTDYTGLATQYMPKADSNSTLTSKINAITDYTLIKRKPCVCFIFDDGNDTDVSIKKVFDTYGVKCGFAPITIADRYVDYYNEGYSILAHGSSLPQTQTEQTIRTFLTERKEVVENRGIKCLGWVTPSSALDTQFRGIVYDLYDYGFTVYKGADTSNVHIPLTTKSYDLWRSNCDVLSLSQCKAIVDECVTNSDMVCFYSHGTIPTADLSELISYCVSNAQVMPPDKCMRYFYTFRANEDGFEPTTAQLAAMNSGITSEDVEQISTNKNNISNKIGASDYATQNTGGTVRVWTTTDGTDTILHIANEAPTP